MEKIQINPWFEISAPYRNCCCGDKTKVNKLSLSPYKVSDTDFAWARKIWVKKTSYDTIQMLHHAKKWSSALHFFSSFLWENMENWVNNLSRWKKKTFSLLQNENWRESNYKKKVKALQMISSFQFESCLSMFHFWVHIWKMNASDENYSIQKEEMSWVRIPGLD